MNFAGKAIDKMTNDELVKANTTLDGMLQNYNDKIALAKERHKKFSLNNPDRINTTFTETSAAIKAEINKRGI